MDNQKAGSIPKPAQGSRFKCPTAEEFAETKKMVDSHSDLVDLAKRFRVFLDSVPGCSDLDCKQNLCTAIRADRLQIETVLARCGEGK